MGISSGTPMAAFFPIRTAAAVGNQIRDDFHNLERGAGHRSALTLAPTPDACSPNFGLGMPVAGLSISTLATLTFGGLRVGNLILLLQYQYHL